MATTGPMGDGHLHRTYAALMADPAYDPSSAAAGASAGTGAEAELDPTEGYLAIFARWRSSGENVPTTEQVHRDLLTDFDTTIGAVGYFVASATSPVTGILKVTHGYRTFSGPPTSTTDRGRTFAYVGDVVGGTDLDTFELDPSQLGCTPETRCAPSPELHMELLEATAEGTPAIGPIADEDLPGVTVASLKTRRAMFIPYGLVEYVLDKDLTARAAFEILWPVIQAKGWTHCTRPLVEFLMVSTTLHSTDFPPRTMCLTLGLGPTSSAAVLAERRDRVLLQQLPALRPSNGGGLGSGGPLPQQMNGMSHMDPFMAALIAQVAQLNDHTRIDREDRREYREKAALPKTVRERFQDYVTDKLMSLTDSVLDEDLPRIYHALAGRQKSVSKRMLLQQEYDLTAEELNLDRLPASASHVLDLDQWDFVGSSMDAVGTGLLPFSIIPPDAPSKQAKKALLEDAERGRQYDMSGEAVAGAISATDAKKLYNAKGYVPTDWAEADIQLELYGVMLGTVLGTKHAVTKNHLLAYRAYLRCRTRLQASMNRKYGPGLAPALLVLHFQLHYRSWFQDRFVFQTVDSPEPDVATGFQLFNRSNQLNWLPNYDDIPCIAALAPAPHPAPVSAGATGNRTGGGGGGSGGNRPATGGGNSPSPTTPSTAPAMVTRVQNSKRDGRLLGNTPLAANVKTRPIRAAIEAAGGPAPTVTRDGVSMSTCLSWHVKGTCFAECTRCADHVANTAEEKETLWLWAQTAYA